MDSSPNVGSLPRRARRVDGTDDQRQPQPPRATDHGARAEEESRRERERATDIREHGRESWDDKAQEDTDAYAGDDRHQRRVQERRAYLRCQFGALLQLAGELLEDHIERTTRLARRDHGDEERVEIPWLFRQRIRESRSGLHG